MDVQKWAYWGALGTCIGAWLGAVPIPLDWDREWQVSPLEINSDVVEMADYDHCGGVYWTCSWISCGDGVCGNK